jgi:16S rRNA (guanine966-N2)-methyltransferase
MRVIAGSARGTRLVAPRGARTRPTADRVREAVFSILGPLDGLRVLDLFAGSGALGIEALSRGARSATLIDNDPRALAAIARNLEATGIEAERRRAGAVAFLRDASRERREYDLVFIDPPYSRAETLAPRLSAGLGEVLAQDARVVAESSARAPLALELPLLDERRYGQTLIRIHGP